MKDLLGLIIFLGSGIGQVLIFGLILACILPEGCAEILGSIFGVILIIMLIVLFVKFVMFILDLMNGKF